MLIDEAKIHSQFMNQNMYVELCARWARMAMAMCIVLCSNQLYAYEVKPQAESERERHKQQSSLHSLHVWDIDFYCCTHKPCTFNREITEQRNWQYDFEFCADYPQQRRT